MTRLFERTARVARAAAGIQEQRRHVGGEVEQLQRPIGKRTLLDSHARRVLRT